jgi:hypothetical protein
MGVLTSCFVTFTVAMLFVSMLGGIYGQGRKRVFLGGFAIGAWGFLFLAYGAFDLDNFGNKMLTTEAVNAIGRVWLGQPPSWGSTANLDPLENARWQLDDIGNCFFTLTFGTLCAFVALRFARDASRYENTTDHRFKALSGPTRAREVATTSLRSDL